MTVSVLIPSHNRADLLRRTLASFRDVEVPEGSEVEVIVTANACTDGTVEMLEGLAADYPLPFRFFHEKTPGANIARNRCLREARGGILAFVDDDIQFDPEWLSGLTDVFENTPADVVGGRIKLWWEAVNRPGWVDDELAHILSAYDLGEEIKHVGLPGPVGANMALHRRVYDELGPMHTGIQDSNNSLNRGDEVEYLHRAGQEGFTAFYAPEALVYHWVDPEQIEPDFFAEAGRGFGHSRVNMKEHFGPLTAARSSAGYLYLAGWHGLQQALGWSVGKTAEQYYHSYVKNIGVGGLKGTYQRIKAKYIGYYINMYKKCIK